MNIALLIVLLISAWCIVASFDLFRRGTRGMAPILALMVACPRDDWSAEALALRLGDGLRFEITAASAHVSLLLLRNRGFVAECLRSEPSMYEPFRVTGSGIRYCERARLTMRSERGMDV